MQIEHQGVKFLWRDDVGGTHRKAYDKGQFYEQPLLNRIQSLNRDGTYIDIGGNVGNHSIFFAKLCPSTRVMTFEPAKNALSFLRDHIMMNKLQEKVEVYDYGLSDSEGISTFMFRGRREVEIRTKVFDRIEEFRDISDVTIMKLDTEGSEARIISGCRAMIRRCMPVIFCEANSDEHFFAVLKELKPLGYEHIRRVSRRGSPMYEFSAQPFRLKER